MQTELMKAAQQVINSWEKGDLAGAVNNMREVLEAAQQVINSWEKGDLAGAVNNMREVLEDMDEASPDQIAQARERYDETAEIDDDALVSETDDGVWVSAWVFLPDDSTL